MKNCLSMPSYKRRNKREEINGSGVDEEGG